MERYIVKPEDLKGEIEDFPIEVVQRMVDYQVKQGNKANVSVFQLHKSMLFKGGGFHWDETIEGKQFWGRVILDEDFDLFFNRYPHQLKEPQHTEDPKHEQSSLYTAIAEAVKSVVNADTSVEVEEKDGTVVIRAVKRQEEDLPIDTPCMVSHYGDTNFMLRYYAGNKECYDSGRKSKDFHHLESWNYIIPFDKFNPNDIKESLKHNIVKL